MEQVSHQSIQDSEVGCNEEITMEFEDLKELDDDLEVVRSCDLEVVKILSGQPDATLVEVDCEMTNASETEQQAETTHVSPITDLVTEGCEEDNGGNLEVVKPVSDNPPSDIISTVLESVQEESDMSLEISEPSLEVKHEILEECDTECSLENEKLQENEIEDDCLTLFQYE